MLIYQYEIKTNESRVLLWHRICTAFLRIIFIGLFSSRIPSCPTIYFVSDYVLSLRSNSVTCVLCVIHMLLGRGSTGSNPFSSGSNPSSASGKHLSGSENGHWRASCSSSSHSSVESVIEEFKERKRSFEKSDRKRSTPDLMNTSQTEQQSLSPGVVARGNQWFSS